MNSGQMLLTMAAMFLLSIVIVSTNNTYLTTGDIMYNTKYNVLAVSLGTSMIEEASSRAFDSATDTSSVSDLNLLTAPGSLGHSPSEHYPNFNDFDDYNNLVKVDSTMPSATFTISCRVGYISPTNPDVFVNQRTWHKRIEVSVTSPSMKETVKLSSVFSYWFFR